VQTLRPRALVLAGAVGVLAGALLAGACAYTTSSAVLPSHLRTVAVPVFENATSEYTLQQEITDAVVERLVRDNRLKVVDERSADCVVRGKVTEYKNSVFGFSAQNRAQEYRVAITVQIVFKDQVKNREMWRDDTMVKTANYYVQDVPGQTARTELDGRKEAIQKIADEILSRSTQGW
jgi:hypothetical protein